MWNLSKDKVKCAYDPFPEILGTLVSFLEDKGNGALHHYGGKGEEKNDNDNHAWDLPSKEGKR
ncbi:hypothetical protein SESBI_24553 [Sesbania bispinosa]|nr:hypothetical protein SESBI_24553 [Sesbania bispinosa]